MFTYDCSVGTDFTKRTAILPDIEMRDSVKLFKALHFESDPQAVRDMFVARSDVSKRATRASDAGKLHLPPYHLELAKSRSDTVRL